MPHYSLCLGALSPALRGPWGARGHLRHLPAPSLRSIWGFLGAREAEAETPLRLRRVLCAGGGDRGCLSFLGWGMGAGRTATYPPQLLRGKECSWRSVRGAPPTAPQSRCVCTRPRAFLLRKGDRASHLQLGGLQTSSGLGRTGRLSGADWWWGEWGGPRPLPSCFPGVGPGPQQG